MSNIVKIKRGRPSRKVGNIVKKIQANNNDNG